MSKTEKKLDNQFVKDMKYKYNFKSYFNNNNE